jgi:ribosome maturation factor RimP
MAELRERLIALAEPLLADLGYELVDIEYVPGRGQSMVRLYLDWPGGVAPAGVGDEADENRSYEGIGVDDCEKVSREFSALLDVEDPISNAYTLEVSSPGMDRILRTLAHYQRFVGERVHVELIVPRNGRRRYTGQLVRADDEGIELNVDGAPVTMSIAEIGKTRLAPDWQAQSPRR